MLLNDIVVLIAMNYALSTPRPNHHHSAALNPQFHNGFVKNILLW